MIRKIIIGVNPKDAMAYFIGMPAGGGQVVAIVENDEVDRFEVFIENTEGTLHWKSIKNMPVIVEYDCKF